MSGTWWLGFLGGFAVAEAALWAVALACPSVLTPLWRLADWLCAPRDPDQ